jgi:two-component system, cell cycle sensor histidine kinase and response regulator CckA
MALDRVNILLVDDRPDGLLTMEAVLERPDYNLVSVSSGKEALIQLQQNDFAVVLLDVQMPNMDGFETAARIKEIPRAQNVPILFITAIHKDPFYIHQGYHLGAVDYIFKPFDPAILRSKVTVFVSLFRQQLQLKQQAQALHLKEQELFQAQKLEAIGRLAGGVAHDFNNLITGILGLSHDIWTSLEASDTRRDDMDEIIKASTRALGLTKQLLAFGRRQITSPRVLDVNSITVDMMKMLKRLIGEDIELIVKNCSALKAIKMDQGQLEQMIMNLVLNARDAMPQGGTITLTTDNIDIGPENQSRSQPVPPGTYVLIRIADTGIGMETQTLDHIFEPYYTTKDKDKGTGLGLSTVYGVVMQCGGHIQVDSTPGMGTTFNIYLPSTPEGLHTEASVEATGRMTIGHGETVLVVEDEGIVRQVATRILRKNGYNVIEAEDAKDALELSEDYQAPIDLLVTDVVMPGMNGLQLAEELLKRRPQLAVLYMSGYSEEMVMHRGASSKDISFIEKTFSAPQLLTKVRETLDGPPTRKSEEMTTQSA